MPDWLGGLLALGTLVGFVAFAFRQGTKTKPSGDNHDTWSRHDGTHDGFDGHH